MFQHTYREGNMAANWVARYDYITGSTVIFAFLSLRVGNLSIIIANNLAEPLRKGLSKFLVLNL